MKLSDILRVFVALFLVAFPGSSALRAQGGEVPVVVAVDTSRSLDAAALAAVGGALSAALEALPASTPVALVAFDDTPRWIEALPSTPAAVGAALSGLVPTGNFTQLNDALFVATRELEEGGVILLATDGRDESSATTVEDMARRSEAQGVRIVAVGVGRIEERALRRLALLTGGAYLGRLDGVGGEVLAAAVEEARAGVAAERAEREASMPSASPLPVQSISGGEASTDEASTDASGEKSAVAISDPALLIGALGALSLGLLMAVVALWRRKRSSPEPDDFIFDDGEPAAHEAAVHVPPAPAIDRDELLNREVLPPSALHEVTGETAVFAPPSEDGFDGTRVLLERFVLEVREPGEDPRAYVLEDRKAFAVGRLNDGENTLALADAALSAHHLRLVPMGGRWFLVDLNSTNGILVADERVVGAREVRPGETVRAGQVELIVKRDLGQLRTVKRSA